MTPSAKDMEKAREILDTDGEGHLSYSYGRPKEKVMETIAQALADQRERDAKIAEQWLYLEVANSDPSLNPIAKSIREGE